MEDREDLKLFKDIMMEQSKNEWEEFFKYPKIYRKKPETIQAIQFREDNLKECKKFTQGQLTTTKTDEGMKGKLGDILISIGDYIVLDEDKGKFGICSEQDFNKHYEIYCGW